MTDRALGIAMQARHFAVLADKPELRRLDARERMEIMLRDGGLGGVNPADRVLIRQTTELDILCGYAVQLLRRDGAKAKAALDLLGVLHPDRVLAVLWALPATTREAIRRADGTWGFLSQQVEDDDLARAVGFVAELAGADDPGQRAAILATMNGRDTDEAQRFERVLSGVEEPTPADAEAIAWADRLVEEARS